MDFLKPAKGDGFSNNAELVTIIFNTGTLMDELLCVCFILRVVNPESFVLCYSISGTSCTDFT